MRTNWRAKDDPRFTPVGVMKVAQSADDVIQGLVPTSGITWIYGPSMSFKSFVAMSMANAIAEGDDWLGRKTKKSQVLYIGAEGGDGLQWRRAAVEFSSGRAARDLVVASERPQLDTKDGIEFLRGMLEGLYGAYSGSDADNPIHRSHEQEEDGPYGEAVRLYAMDSVVGDWEEDLGSSHYVIIIDTYSQTSDGDDKTNVSAYVKNLRSVVDEFRKHVNEWVTFIVIDHATKAGGSFLGSVAKLNDVDSQLEIAREGSSMRAKILHRKFKDDHPQHPISIELVPYEFEGCVNAYGEPIRSLIVRDGTKAASIADIADGNPGALLTIILDAGGSISEREAREAFYALPRYAGANRDTASKAFKRAKDALEDMQTLVEKDGVFEVGVL